jgi:hypothetical protein
MTVMALAFSVVLSSCTFGGGSVTNAVCEPDTTEEEPILGPEAQASSDHGIEVWALFFASYPIPEGEPIRIPQDSEIKIVWRVTGSGELAIEAAGPDGLAIAPDWGPDLHSGSNWERPGDEWGTGWTFPEPGCWTLLLQRGEAQALLSVDITT